MLIKRNEDDTMNDGSPKRILKISNYRESLKESIYYVDAPLDDEYDSNALQWQIKTPGGPWSDHLGRDSANTTGAYLRLLQDPMADVDVRVRRPGHEWTYSERIPKFTVILIAYRLERFVGQAINSVTEQTTRDWELIAIDDGSDDETLQVITECADRDSRIKCLSVPNSGISHARNLGVLHGKRSELIIFLDGDDLLLPSSLETFGHYLEAYPEAVGCAGRKDWIDENGEKIEPTWKGDYPLGLMDYGEVVSRDFFVGVYPPSSVCLRREVVEAAGGFDSALRHCEDYDFYKRVLLHGPFIFIDKTVTAYRRRDGQATSMNQHYWSELSSDKASSYDRAWSRRHGK